MISFLPEERPSPFGGQRSALHCFSSCSSLVIRSGLNRKILVGEWEEERELRTQAWPLYTEWGQQATFFCTFGLRTIIWTRGCRGRHSKGKLLTKCLNRSDSVSIGKHLDAQQASNQYWMNQCLLSKFADFENTVIMLQVLPWPSRRLAFLF